MRWGSLRAGSPTGRQSGFIRQNYGRPDRRRWQERRKRADGSQHSTKKKKTPKKPHPFFLTTWSKSARISEHAGKRRVGRSLSFIYAREQWAKCTFQGCTPFGFLFLPISLRPVYSQWRCLSEADRLCLFSCSHIQFQTQRHFSCKIRFPVFDFPPQRVKGYSRVFSGSVGETVGNHRVDLTRDPSLGARMAQGFTWRLCLFLQSTSEGKSLPFEPKRPGIRMASNCRWTWDRIMTAGVSKRPF